MHSRLISLILGTSLITLIPGIPCKAEDWPTYMGDAARSGVSPDVLPTALQRRWTFTPTHPPCPSTPAPGKEPRRIEYDLTNHIAAAQGAVYIASSADDQIRCFNAGSGRLCWTAFANGPIRVAPTFWQNRLYIGSDDGFAYCLDAVTGDTLWTFQGAPQTRHALGNGRVISVWPIRSGVLVRAGIAYFVAGLFPSEGVFVCAIDAMTGKLIWRNGASGQLYRQLPHPGAEGFSGVAPQGPILASEEYLYVPTGRNVPAAYDLQTGELVQYHPENKMKIGGTYCTVVDDLVFNGPAGLIGYQGNDGSTVAKLPGIRFVADAQRLFLLSAKSVDGFQRTPYLEAVKQHTMLYLQKASLTPKRWRADYDLKQLRWKGKGETPEANKLTSKLEAINAEIKALETKMTDIVHEIDATRQWQVPIADGRCLVVCANAIAVGTARNTVLIDRKTGSICQKIPSANPVAGLAIADSRLFVSDEAGHVTCYAAGTSLPPPQKAQAEEPPAVSSEVRKLVRLISTTGAPHHGYAVILGAESDEIIQCLAETTELNLYGLGTSTEQLKTARKRLVRIGIYGSKATVLGMCSDRAPFPDYMANLIVVNDAEVPIQDNEILRMMRPAGGVLMITETAIPKIFPGGFPKELQATSPVKGWLRLERGALRGTAPWTHQYADAGNSSCSNDTTITTPLGVLWFGGPGPADLVNRHSKAAAPLCAGGHMYLSGEDVIYAIDAYNGAPLWDRRIPGTRSDSVHSDAAHIAAVAGALYIIQGEHCLRIDPETGQTVNEFSLPDKHEEADEKSLWGHLAVVGERLYGSIAMPYTLGWLEEDRMRSLVRRGVSWDAINKVRDLGPAVFRTRAQIDERIKGVLNEWEYRTFGERLLGQMGLPVGGVACQTVFALDRHSGNLIWSHRFSSGYVHHNAIAHSPDRMFLAISSDQKSGFREIVALDNLTGVEKWRHAPIEDTDLGKAFMALAYANGTLLAFGSQGSSRMIALNAEDGVLLWDRKGHFGGHPVVTNDTVYSEPGAYRLRSGEPKMRSHPITGVPVPWEFSRAYGCGTISGTRDILLFRSGTLGYYDLRRDDGIGNWGALRPSCWVSTIVADGLVLAPEGSSGCTCSYPMQTSMALLPVPRHENWSVYNTDGPTLPVTHLALNLGAPGDRRATDGRIWLGFPRPPARRKLELPVRIAEPSQIQFRHINADSLSIVGTPTPWIFASAAVGPLELDIPLRKADPASPQAKYRIRLMFAELKCTETEKRAFSVSLQGKTVLKHVDILAETGGIRRALVKEIGSIAVTDVLRIRLCPMENSAPPSLSGIEIISN